MTDTTAGEGFRAKTERMTKAELTNLFGETMPVDAVAILADDRLSLSEARNAIADLAEALAAQPSAGAQMEAVAMYVAMPLNADSNGPADETETVRIEHQVWDAATNETLCVSTSEATARHIASLINATPSQPDTGDVAALREALEPVAGCLTAFSFDPDEGDAEEIDVTMTRSQIKRLCALAGLDPVTGAALSKPNAQGREG